VSNNREFTVEVKYDSKAYLWAKRRGTPKAPNLYIEFKNTNQGKDSGILMSKADYYLYIIKDGVREIGYIFIREQLLKHLQESDYKVVGNSASGDDNALGWIPPLNSLTNTDYGFRGTIDLTNYVY
jgi:hypothetical protein